VAAQRVTALALAALFSPTTSSCWSQGDLVDGFTPDQWAHLQAQLAFPPQGSLDPCAFASLASPCSDAIALAGEIFVDASLSSTGTVSCATCHDPNDHFIDSRSANNVSFGATGWTKRNTPTLSNVAYKALFATQPAVFTWSGQYASPGGVLELALTKPMASSDDQAAAAIVANPTYVAQFTAAFGESPSSLASSDVVASLEHAFDAYFATSVFVTSATPFDRYLAGDATAISDSAARGFGVFVGRGTCIECHSGPLFSDLSFHDTGTPQQGDNVVPIDIGRAEVTLDAADTSKFLTGSLRGVASTAPFMHDGSIASLADVITFYRDGGVASGFGGTKDPRIVPLDITDDDANDLESFLNALSECDGSACAQ
jgi:cytochrome c peroxidase